MRHWKAAASIYLVDIYPLWICVLFKKDGRTHYYDCCFVVPSSLTLSVSEKLTNDSSNECGIEKLEHYHIVKALQTFKWLKKDIKSRPISWKQLIKHICKHNQIYNFIEPFRFDALFLVSFAFYMPAFEPFFFFLFFADFFLYRSRFIFYLFFVFFISFSFFSILFSFFSSFFRFFFILFSFFFLLHTRFHSIERKKLKWNSCRSNW